MQKKEEKSSKESYFILSTLIKSFAKNFGELNVNWWKTTGILLDEKIKFKSFPPERMS